MSSLDLIQALLVIVAGSDGRLRLCALASALSWQCKASLSPSRRESEMLGTCSIMHCSCVCPDFVVYCEQERQQVAKLQLSGSFFRCHYWRRWAVWPAVSHWGCIFSLRIFWNLLEVACCQECSSDILGCEELKFWCWRRRREIQKPYSWHPGKHVIYITDLTLKNFCEVASIL